MSSTIRIFPALCLKWTVLLGLGESSSFCHNWIVFVCIIKRRVKKKQKVKEKVRSISTCNFIEKTKRRNVLFYNHDMVIFQAIVAISIGDTCLIISFFNHCPSHVLTPLLPQHFSVVTCYLIIKCSFYSTLIGNTYYSYPSFLYTWHFHYLV